MFSQVMSATTFGIEAYIVKVESHLEGAIPNFITVGLPDGAVRESKERVNAAIKNSGFTFPIKRITVNLAPADIRKAGSLFDLPIATGILAAHGQVHPTLLDRFVLLGELSLDGRLRPVTGALSISVKARAEGMKGIVLPAENAGEAAMTEGLEVYPVKSLGETVAFLNGDIRIAPHKVDLNSIFASSNGHHWDFQDVKGTRRLWKLKNGNRSVNILWGANCACGLRRSIQARRAGLSVRCSLSRRRQPRYF